MGSLIDKLSTEYPHQSPSSGDNSRSPARTASPSSARAPSSVSCMSSPRREKSSHRSVSHSPVRIAPVDDPEEAMLTATKEGGVVGGGYVAPPVTSNTSPMVLYLSALGNEGVMTAFRGFLSAMQAGEQWGGARRSPGRRRGLDRSSPGRGASREFNLCFLYRVNPSVPVPECQPNQWSPVEDLKSLRGGLPFPAGKLVSASTLRRVPGTLKAASRTSGGYPWMT